MAQSTVKPTAKSTVKPVDELVRLLEPDAGPAGAEPVAADVVGLFAGRPAGAAGRMFGGLIAAQALAAAGRTVRAGRPVHSLHGTFVRAGDGRSATAYRVEKLRDGRSMSTRRVVAAQRGTPIFFLTASFHDPDPGLIHQDPLPPVPPPHGVPPALERLAGAPEEVVAVVAEMLAPFDARYLGGVRWAPADAPAETPAEGPPDPAAQPGAHRAWIRVKERLPDDPLLHATALAYVSDLPLLLDSILAAHGEVWGPGGYFGASLDHSVWFHRPVRADEWLLYDCHSPWAGGSRGLATGRLYSLYGDLVATVAQEGLLRPMGGRPVRQRRAVAVPGWKGDAGANPLRPPLRDGRFPI